MCHVVGPGGAKCDVSFNRQPSSKADTASWSVGRGLGGSHQPTLCMPPWQGPGIWVWGSMASAVVPSRAHEALSRLWEWLQTEALDPASRGAPLGLGDGLQ